MYNLAHVPDEADPKSDAFSPAIWLMFEVAKKYDVAPFTSHRAYVEMMAPGLFDTRIRAVHRTFVVLSKEAIPDIEARHRMAEEALKWIEKEYPLGSMVVWRLPPSFETYVDGRTSLRMRLGRFDRAIDPVTYVNRKTTDFPTV